MQIRGWPVRRIESLINRVVKLEARKEIASPPLVLASGLLIDIGGADLARLFREIDGRKKRGAFPPNKSGHFIECRCQ
jgi:hypothetical protein